MSIGSTTAPPIVRRIVSLALGAACCLAASVSVAQSDQLAAARAEAAAHPGDPAASLRLGRVLRRAGIYQAAATELRKVSNSSAARSGPLAIPIHRELALVAIDQGNYDQAMRACRAIAALPSGAAMSHACVAEAFMIRKRATEALPEVAKALQVDPTLYEAKVVEGYAKWQSAAEAQAEAAFKAAADANPQRPEAFVGLGRLLSALNRPPEALAALEKAYAADPADPVAALALGSVLAPSDRTVTVLRSAIAARPSAGAAHARLADVLLELGRLDQAEQEARLAIQTGHADASWHAILGAVLVRRGQFDPALAEASAALQQIPNLARAKLVEADARAAKREIDLNRITLRWSLLGLVVAGSGAHRPESLPEMGMRSRESCNGGVLSGPRRTGRRSCPSRSPPERILATATAAMGCGSARPDCR